MRSISAFATSVGERPDVVFVSLDQFFASRRVQLVHLASRYAIPATYALRDFVEAGGLMSYGANLMDAYRQVGVYTGRILRGATPANFPVVQASKFELVINHQTARLLGLTVPPSLLALTDEVISHEAPRVHHAARWRGGVAELKPKVVETFDNIADAYKRLRRLQDQDIQNKLRNDSLSPAQERRYKKLKDDIIAEVKSLRLNQARIDALVEQLYDINKRLVGYEGRLMRLSESHGVSREDFLRNYPGLRARPALAQPGVETLRQGLEEPGRQGQGQGQAASSEFRCSPARPGSRSASSARSCTWCRRASAKPARPRRRWWRRTCAS